MPGESPIRCQFVVRAYSELVWNDIIHEALTLTLSQRERGTVFVSKQNRDML